MPNRSGRTSSRAIFDAHSWAQEHADRLATINCSWGARSDVPAINREHMQLVSAGVRDVVAAGNTGAEGGSPATASDVYGIGAMTEAKELTRFSSYNPGAIENPDVVALGKDIRLPRATGTSLGTVLDEDHVKASGTSFSAPIATGAMTLYLETNEQATERPLERTAKNIPGTPRDVHGYLRYRQATAPRTTEADVEVFDLPFTDADGVALPDNWVEAPTRAVLERDTHQETVVRFER